MKNLFKNPIVQTVAVTIVVIILWPRIRTFLAQIPVIGAWV